MAIESIQRISMAAPSNAITSTMTATKTLQSQLQMKQQSLNKLSNDASLTAEEKAKQERAYKKEIEMLKRKLEQLRQKQEKEENSKKTESNKEVKVNTETDVKKLDETESDKEVTEADTEEKTEIKELSLDEVQKILDDNFALKETMIEQGVAYDKENYVRRLTSEIRQDQLLGSDTTSKEKELEKLLTQENHWQNAKTKQTTAEPAPIIHPDVQISIS